ncbi:Ig domain-containing protein [Leptospira interrogans]|uniref:Ig domain-containing protein n=1 Tax=Leptospira interrogans TaxID=173 RepID=UPI0007747B64|nr:Ig domain-containing protein [Leptospira interrogans]
MKRIGKVFLNLCLLLIWNRKPVRSNFKFLRIVCWVVFSFVVFNCDNKEKGGEDLLIALIGTSRPPASLGNSTDTNAPTVTFQYSDTGGSILNRSYPVLVSNMFLTPTITQDPNTSLEFKSFSISPNLPAGIFFDSFTGWITGTPTVTVPSSEYTISLNYSIRNNKDRKLYQDQSATAKISFSTNYDPTLTYSFLQPGNNILSLGVGITYLPTVNGFGSGTITYSISPATLLAGLNFNTSNGTIFGTPTTVTGSTNYTITATNVNASDSVSFSLQVAIGQITALSYPSCSSQCTFPTNSPIASMNPSYTPNIPNQISSWSISPVLPAGLSFNTSTGVISGTPTSVSDPATTYTVTATNSAGSRQTTFTLATRNVVFGYFTPVTGYTQPMPGLNRFSTSIIPSNPSPLSGSPITSFTITPALPAGLFWDSSTGNISGYPVSTSSGNYTVTANTAADGSSSTSIFISIGNGESKCYYAGTIDGCTFAAPYSCGVSNFCYTSLTSCINSPECVE